MSVYQMGLVWRHSQQSGNALLVLLKIADHANDFGLCFPGVARLAEAARISQRQARTILRRLERAGELRVYVKGGPVVSTRGGVQHLNLYRILVGGQEGGEVDFRTLEIRGAEVSTQGAEAATSAEPSVEPSDSHEILTLLPEGQELPTNGKKVPGEVAALVDLFRALPGVQPSRKDGGVIGDLFKRYGAAALRRAIEEDGPSIAAADNPLLWLAGAFKRSRGHRGLDGPTLADRKAEILRNLRGTP